jgi:hypothetical protein
LWLILSLGRLLRYYEHDFRLILLRSFLVRYAWRGTLFYLLPLETKMSWYLGARAAVMGNVVRPQGRTTGLNAHWAPGKEDRGASE